MPPMTRAVAGVLIVLSLAGCATTNMGTPGDPLERMNRATHRFNVSVDRAVLRPVAELDVTPTRLRIVIFAPPAGG